ncbi:MAG TPA: MFS transporter [Gemmatimonadaceae bacterium]|nr:MFS transporter [Gemmatimonadaceae bacterium]
MMRPDAAQRVTAGSPRGSASLWRPLRIAAFRNLLIADLIADIGSFMLSVGAAWLMVSLKAGPVYVALTQTATSLPFLVLALPAGATGDMVDHRKLILYTEMWMVSMAFVIALLTITSAITPLLLLVLTFSLSAGDAFEMPTWRATLPDLVPHDDLEAASALNGIEFNLARAVGPALAGILIAGVGISAAFVVNMLSFLGVILVIARWKNPRRKRPAHPETLVAATATAFRFVRGAPAMRAVIVRAGAGFFFASAVFALLPLLAHGVTPSAAGYGLLLGCFGAGSILGAFGIQPLRARLSTDALVSIGIVVMGLTMIAIGMLRRLSAIAPVIVLAGGAWILLAALVNSVVQDCTPEWVRARANAIFILVTQGGMAVGSAAWGVLAQLGGVRSAFMWAGLGAVGTSVLGLFMKLPEPAADLNPWSRCGRDAPV